MSKVEIKNVERIIPMEKNFGIAIEGVFAECEIVGDKLYVNVFGEVVSLNNTGIEDDISITMTAYNAENKVIARGQESIYAEDFMGLASFEICTSVIQTPSRIRIYPEK